MNSQAYEGPQVIASKVYPQIAIRSVSQWVFATQPKHIPKDARQLHPTDPLSDQLFGHTKRLFSEITLHKDELWMHRTISTLSFLVYFAGSNNYPISNCCEVAVYIDFRWDFSGSIYCINCKKSLCSFVKSNAGVEPSKTIFKERVRNTQQKIHKLKGDLLSKRFRVKDLKKDLVCSSKNDDCFILEFAPRSYQSQLVETNQRSQLNGQELPQRLSKLKSVILDIFA